MDPFEYYTGIIPGSVEPVTPGITGVPSGIPTVTPVTSTLPVATQSPAPTKTPLGGIPGSLSHPFPSSRHPNRLHGPPSGHPALCHPCRSCYSRYRGGHLPLPAECREAPESPTPCRCTGGVRPADRSQSVTGPGDHDTGNENGLFRRVPGQPPAVGNRPEKLLPQGTGNSTRRSNLSAGAGSPGSFLRNGRPTGSPLPSRSRSVSTK